MKRQNNMVEGLKNWTTVDFSVYQESPVFGIVFNSENDALNAMVKLQEFKPDKVVIARLSNGQSMFFVSKYISERKDESFVLKIHPDLDNSEKFSLFRKALDTGRQPYMMCMFLENGKVYSAPKGKIALLKLRECLIQENQDPLLFDEPSLN